MARMVDPDDPDETYCRECGVALATAEYEIHPGICRDCRDDEGSEDDDN